MKDHQIHIRVSKEECELIKKAASFLSEKTGEKANMSKVIVFSAMCYIEGIENLKCIEKYFTPTIMTYDGLLDALKKNKQ